MLLVGIRKELPGFTLDVRWESDAGVVALFGPSGSGKSLTLQCLAGLVAPDRGRIELDGEVYFDRESGTDHPARVRRVGYVFQGYALFPHMTVEQNVAFGLKGRSRREQKLRTDHLLERLDLVAQRHARPGALSGGQQQRVALGRALAGEPALLLLDEPLSALDASLRRRVRADLLGAIREFGRTTVIVTHDLSEAYHLADHVVVYERGRVVQSARKADVLTTPASIDVARLIGVRNLLEGRVLSASETMVTIGWAGHRLQAARLPGWSSPVPDGTAISFFVRPEHIRLVRKDRPGPAARRMNVLSGKVVDETDLGTTMTLRFAVEPAGHDQPDPAGRDPAGPAVLEIDVSKLVYQMLNVRDDWRWEVAIQPSAVQVLP